MYSVTILHAMFYYYCVVMSIRALYLFIYLYEWYESLIELGSSEYTEYTKYVDISNHSMII